MKRFLSNGLALVAGVVSTPAVATNPLLRNLPAERRVDPRAETLRRFFRKGGYPLEQQAEVFLEAADANRLDWTLLPSLSVIESGGRGRRNNNIFGWKNGAARFRSVPAGIRSVAGRLRESELYRDKNTDQILRTYNSGPDYGAAVKTVMRQIRACARPLPQVYAR